MNIISLYKRESLPKISRSLYDRMEHSLKSAGADFDKSVRIAKVIAPILQDQSSNARHLKTIDSEAPVQDKVIAIIMLGFPKNREILPVLREILLNKPDSLRIAAAIAISQMAEPRDKDLFTDILMEGFKASQSAAVKKIISQSVLNLMDKKSAQVINELFNEIRP
jgi:HEAT repeat protein